MKAIVLHQKGGPEELRYEDVPDPEPKNGELRVRIEAAGINHIDLTWRAGGPPKLPAILGVDAAGRRVDTDQRVLVANTLGTYAELVAAKQENVFSTPDSLDTAAAARWSRRARLGVRTGRSTSGRCSAARRKSRASAPHRRRGRRWTY